MLMSPVQILRKKNRKEYNKHFKQIELYYKKRYKKALISLRKDDFCERIQGKA